MKKTLILFAVLSLLVCTVFNAFAGDVEKALSHDLSECSGIIKQLAGRLRSGAIPTDDLARLKKCAEALQADRLLLAERQVALAERAATLDGTAPDRQDGVSSALLRNLDELLVHLDTVGASTTSSDLEVLQRLLDTLIPKRSRPLLGGLPYKHTNNPPREPASTPIVKPAYNGGDRSVYAADTAASPEAPLSREIVDLAQSLQWNPVLIYEWVKNNVETEWYWGSMKGAEETLRQKSGNDADQASLLVALLRASNFPARYVRGTIDFFPDIERAKNLTGLDDPASIADFFRKAGIPSTPVISGGRVSNLHIEHVWVEAFIPYANYRGAVVDDQGKIWLGLDTSIKPQGYTHTTGGGIPSDTLSTLRDDYLNTVQTLSPLDYLTGKLDEQLAVSQPGTTWASLKDTATLIPDVLKIIPDSMQFNQIAITGEYQMLPEDLKHKLTFSAMAGGNELFSITLETHKLSNKSLALRAEPETVEDQNTIDSFGGLDNTPAYLVRLRPVLTLDGERMIVAQDGLPMGADFTLNIDIVTPNGTERISSGHINGNLSAIGVVGQKAQTPTAITEEDDAEAILHKEAIGYIDRWNKAEDDLATLLGQRLSRPAVTIATVGGQMAVTTLLDITHDMQWQGLYLDAGYRRIETTGRNGQEKEFMRLSALQGSVLENRIFEDDLKVDSVSAAKLLQLARANGTPIVTIDKASIDSILPTLPFDDAVNADIANAVNQGLTVTIPQNEVVYQDWSGIGYIKENIETGESGWMLSGNVAGGMTAWLPEKWNLPTLKAISAALRTPYSGKPNANPQDAVRIFKIPVTDQQVGTVDKTPKYNLQVKVTDQTGRQVKGATVSFIIMSGGGNFAGGSNVVTATTDALGLASAPLTLGKKTADNPVYWFTDGNTYSDQYGANIVDAVLDNGTAIDSPFTEYGKPQQLDKLRATHGASLSSVILSYAGFVGLVAEDVYGNPIANQQVTFQLGGTTVNGVCKGKVYDTTRALLIKDGDACINSSPTIIDAQASCTGAAATITSVTSTTGIWAGVVLGGAPGATYPVTATATSKGKNFTAQFAPTSYDFTNCNNNADPRAELFVSSLMASDIYGNIINAGRSGTDISIMAKEYLIIEGLTMAPENLDCNGSTLSCSKIVGAHTFTTTCNFFGNGATVLFNGVPVKNLGNGLFQGIYTLKPGLNTVNIEGAASYVFNSMNNSCSGGCATTPTSTVSTLNAVPASIQVYGVDITIKQPLNIMLNELGRSRNNLKISYTINPADYQASNALILLYKVTDQGGKKNYELIDYIPVEKKGTGFGTIARGYKFDDTQNYAVSVALNYGSTAQIMSDPAPITFAKGAMIPDYNHNRKIDDEDLDRALNNDPYYFWVNDDDGNGDTEGSGMPETRILTNASLAGQIPGTRDIIDWFPVFLDISNVLQKYPASSNSYYLSNESGKLRYVATDLTKSDSGQYLTNVSTATSIIQNQWIKAVDSYWTLPLEQSFLQTVTPDSGVVLIEATGKNQKPLRLEVYDSGNMKVFETSLNLSIDGVEQMFRHKNLINEQGVLNAPTLADGGGAKSRVKDADFTNKEHFAGFDSQNQDKYFVLLHGVNVDGQAARGWHAEMFKRLYWAGSNAKFVGVSWYSTDGPSWGYYPNVIHAFETAAIFGAKLKEVAANSPVTIMAHSLGNMVVSSYLTDHYPNPVNTLNVKSYLMFDAAVALEAYLGDYNGYGADLNGELNADSTMVHSDWFGYQKRFSASEWHRLWDGTSDGRNKLTWRNRFAALPGGVNYVNFFSSGEDVLAKYEGNQPDFSNWQAFIDNFKGRNSWVMQEKWKGRPSGPGGSETMGWGFNREDNQYNPYDVGLGAIVHLGPIKANNSSISDNQLISRPFFLNVVPTGIESVLFSSVSVDFSAIKPFYSRILAEGIPALTEATGGWKGDVFVDFRKGTVTIDMNSRKNYSSWPRKEKEWWHSDIKDVALPYTWPIVQEIVEKGALK